jgi:tetratricopeptide (TPR) repeat protein
VKKVKGGGDLSQKSFTLYLPEDLKTWELIWIIYKIVSKFWLEEFWALDKLVSYTKAVVWTILKNNGSKKEDLDNLAKEYWIPSKFIERLIINEKGSIKMSTRPLIRAVKEWWEKGDKAIKDTLSQEFDLTFFRKAINDIRFWLKITTQAEQDELIEDLNEKWYISFFGNKINYSKWENIVLIISRPKESSEKQLREYIWVDKLKQELKEIRKSWNKKEIEIKELEVAWKVLEWIYFNFNYHSDENEFWYQPRKILETKQVHCVWFSIIWHAILSELWIKHNWLYIPEHSALEVIIWNKKYLFDVFLKELQEFEDESKWKKVWVCTERTAENWYTNLYQSGDVEKILISQIYNNKWVVLYELWRYEEAMEMYDEVLKLNPNNSDGYLNKWNVLYEWKYKEAIEMYNKALELNPNYSFAYNNKWNVLCELWKYKEAIEMYNKALELNPNYSLAYNNKWLVLDKLWRYEEAIGMYDKVLELNPNDFSVYYDKCLVLYKLQNIKLARLHWFVSNLIHWNDIEYTLDEKEKQKIRELIKTQDFEWLRRYLLDLEE